MKKIKNITWNWSPALMESNGDRIDAYSDICESASIDDEKVIKIEKYSCDSFPCFKIHYLEGKIKEIYKPNTVTYEQRTNYISNLDYVSRWHYATFIP